MFCCYCFRAMFGAFWRHIKFRKSLERVSFLTVAPSLSSLVPQPIQPMVVTSHAHSRSPGLSHLAKRLWQLFLFHSFRLNGFNPLHSHIITVTSLRTLFMLYTCDSRTFDRPPPSPSSPVLSQSSVALCLSIVFRCHAADVASGNLFDRIRALDELCLTYSHCSICSALKFPLYVIWLEYLIQ